MNNDRENYKNMLEMAEFAATRMDQRKTVEFRIFISYMTPLILATYYATKVEPENVVDVSWWAIGFLLSALIGIHFSYISWQICLSVAMRNDSQRRNFCLKKAECILHHLSKNTNTPFLPGGNTVKVNIGYSKDENFWTEKELFDKDAAEFETIPTFWKSIAKLCYELKNDWTRPLLTVLPTLMLLLIALILWFKRLYWLS